VLDRVGAEAVGWRFASLGGGSSHVACTWRAAKHPRSASRRLQSAVIDGCLLCAAWGGKPCLTTCPSLLSDSGGADFCGHERPCFLLGRVGPVHVIQLPPELWSLTLTKSREQVACRAESRNTRLSPANPPLTALNCAKSLARRAVASGRDSTRLLHCFNSLHRGQCLAVYNSTLTANGARCRSEVVHVSSPSSTG
jgi:hypothetical protein